MTNRFEWVLEYRFTGPTDYLYGWMRGNQAKLFRKLADLRKEHPPEVHIHATLRPFYEWQAMQTS